MNCTQLEYTVNLNRCKFTSQFEIRTHNIKKVYEMYSMYSLGNTLLPKPRKVSILHYFHRLPCHTKQSFVYGEIHSLS
jgi:hypothetical protein